MLIKVHRRPPAVSDLSSAASAGVRDGPIETRHTRAPRQPFALLLIVLVALAAPAYAQRDPSAWAEQVRAREGAFARTMAERDHAAFTTFLAEEAIFVGKEALRGKAAVSNGWKGFFEGKDAPFSWEPATVEVLESGALALSSGPVFDRAGTRVGTFNSVWRREADGVWRVVLDNGCPPLPCR